MKKIFLCFLLIIIFFTGCNDNSLDEVGKSGNVNYVQAKELVINSGAIMVDVRTKDEYADGHIDGAVSLPLDDISEEKVKEIVKDKYAVMIVYCKSGVRSEKAVVKLNELGYNNVYNLGAMNNWKE